VELAITPDEEIDRVHTVLDMIRVPRSSSRGLAESCSAAASGLLLRPTRAHCRVAPKKQLTLSIARNLGRLSFLGATTVFGTPADVTLEEIALEMLYPADTFTDKTIREAAEFSGRR
jgi:hypothetical protein